MQDKTLLVLPSVPVILNDEKHIFDIKFVEGMRRYADLWKGPIKCLMRLDQSATLPFSAEYEISDLPFNVEFVDALKNISVKELTGADIVLAAGDNFELLHISELSREQKIPCVYIIEYTPETRRQIANIENKENLIQLIKTNIWLLIQEHHRIKAFKNAQGLQANGIPAYNHYIELTNNALQYFDTRMKQNLYANEQELNSKKNRIEKGECLRLAFSGRLEKMKGADHLVPFAHKLKKLGVPFTLEIYGAGSLEEIIIEQIEQNNLTSNVFYKGVVDFETELAPILKNNIDLFICCHRQSDPSCTYLEVLSCGVPIIGYNNKAFKGIIDIAIAEVGEGVPIDNIDGLANLVFNLNNDKKRISTLSKNALKFSKIHTFENEFEKRIRHLDDTLLAYSKISNYRK